VLVWQKVFIVTADDDLPQHDEVRLYAVRALRASASIDRFRKHSSIQDHETTIQLYVSMKVGRGCIILSDEWPIPHPMPLLDGLAHGTP
jgi:hypothetical protein